MVHCSIDVEIDVIGPAEIEDMMSDYTEALAKAGEGQPAGIPVWPLRARAAAVLVGEESATEPAEEGIEPSSQST